jgi:phosphotransferase system enzyme I (PtsI)
MTRGSGSNATTLIGLGASPGVAIGQAWPVDRRRVKTPKYHVPEAGIEKELERLRGALIQSDEQLAEVKARVEGSEGAEHSGIIEAHRMMLKDEMLVLDAEKHIREDLINAEWAVKRAIRKIKDALSMVADEYFRERRADVDYVGERVVKNLMGEVVDVDEPPPDGAIVIAHDLSPADAALLLHERKVAGLVTDAGARTSHTAIVARALEVPAVVGVGRVTELVGRGDWIVVDGSKGVVILNPSEGERADYELARQRYLEHEKALMKTRDLPARTQDGITIRLVGNIEFAEEVPSLLNHGGEGVGLYRTEFLYLGRQDLPTEEEHYQNYKKIVESMSPHPVTIRTFDLGADKLPVGSKSHEDNPAMGLRAIRYCLRHPEIFRPQLRGLLRASAHGQLRVMFPMITGVAELRAAKRMLGEVREELEREGVHVQPIPVGIMVELPSAAMVADRLARECDFLSIGTNDLIQYTMAIDRQNKDVAYLFKPLHLSVLRMIKSICQAAQEAGIPASMCGEMAGEPSHTLILLGLGLTELSMSATYIPLVKRIIRAATVADGKLLLERVLDLTTGDEIERVVRTEMARRFGSIMEEADAALGPALGPVSG